MSLYRLDRADRVPVLDPIMRGDFLTTQALKARTVARSIAAAHRTDVTVTRIHGAGTMKVHYIAKGA
jgi:hypothetical protein